MEGTSNTPSSHSKRPKRSFHSHVSAENTDQSSRIDSSASERNKNKAETKQGRNKGYRPGMNSYLKVVLDDSTIDRLHSCAIRLQHEIQQMSQGTQEGTEEESKGEEPKKRKRALKFKPRSRTSLHTTFFFGGEVLCELPIEELEEWHEKVTNRLRGANFELVEGQSASLSSTSDKEKDSGGDEDSPSGRASNELIYDEEYSLALTGFSLFPPRRNNLIVALLDASPAWHALHDDVRNIAKDGSSEDLSAIVKRSKQRWTPHITLGNLYGGSKKDLRELSTMLESFPNVPMESQTERDVSEKVGLDEMGRIKVHKISMGGPVPQQVSKDWDFVFCPQSSGRAAADSG